MDHEVAAFDLALGVVLLLVARDATRASTQVPVLASFLVVLAGASVFDLVEGNVGWSRLATHLPVAIGFALTLILSRQPENRLVPVANRARPPSIQAIEAALAERRPATRPTEPPADGVPTGDHDTRGLPAARHDAA
jgi:predicted anti-sigma-YlaC factor YlaD